jgi:hypothetical protein
MIGGYIIQVSKPEALTAIQPISSCEMWRELKESEREGKWDKSGIWAADCLMRRLAVY